MWVPIMRSTAARIFADPVTRLITAGIAVSCLIAHFAFGVIASVPILLFYISGSVLAVLSVNNKRRITRWIQATKDYFGYQDCVRRPRGPECSACGAFECRRHRVEETPCTLFLDAELDKAVAGFYSVILERFINSWFSAISTDGEFVYLIRQCLRDATCRLGVAIQSLDMPKLITEKLLPVLFSHTEILTRMMKFGVPIDQFSHEFILKEYPIHPAVCNRRNEIQYLRTVAKGLIPKLISQQHYESNILFTLLRELLATWVLLPLLDVIADPNLLNALIIAATDPPVKRVYAESGKVAFLESFARGSGLEGGPEGDAKCVPKPLVVASEVEDDDLFRDQSHLYEFMQFLKREGAVDLLRFHLDVKQLNKDLQDPRVTMDPAKLSALQQQSEKLTLHYATLVAKMPEDLGETAELNEAHEMIKLALNGRWKREFRRTPAYFELIYGKRSIPEGGEKKTRSLEQIQKSHSGTRLSKQKAPPVEGVEAAAWDAENVSAAPTSSGSQSNANIYSSMTQKLRKERGQNLDQFMVTFMQSIEQTTEVGEDVRDLKNKEGSGNKGHQPPGHSFVFGDLFQLERPPNDKSALNYHLHPANRPSKCFIYIASEILRFPWLVIKLMISLVNISRQTVDNIICSLLQRLLNAGLYEPRLAVLINLLKDQLFGEDESQKAKEPSPQDLLERMRLAKQRLMGLNRNLGTVADMLQSPAMNKHLIYSLFDIIVDEMYPELLLVPRGK